jgi:hypothetical protein
MYNYASRPAFDYNFQNKVLHNHLGIGSLICATTQRSGGLSFGTDKSTLSHKIRGGRPAGPIADLLKPDQVGQRLKLSLEYIRHSWPLMVRPRPPMRLATGVPSSISPPGHPSTMPTHSIPLMGTHSAHSPLRMCISAWLTPNALIRITTSPCFGSGVGTSLMTRDSGPPNFSITIAFIVGDYGSARLYFLNRNSDQVQFL